MSLFVVNRYKDNDSEEDEEKEKEIFLRLSKSIEKRKREKAKKILDIESTEEQKQTVFEEELKETFLEFSEQQKDGAGILEVPPDKDVSSPKTLPQFKILGTSDFEKKIKVKRVLPKWIKNPTKISLNLRNSDCGVESAKFLDSSLKKMLMDEGIKYLFPVQAQVIPWLLEENSHAFWPKDLCVSAPTGSGKTLAYVLPIIQMLKNRVERQVRALVILPVKELANQVAKVFRKYCIGTNLKVALVDGSTTLDQEKKMLAKYTQSAGWICEVDIMVCTAGRFVEHLHTTQGLSLKNLQFLIMDEADRIMDHIQNDWLYHLSRHVGSAIMIGKPPPLNTFTLRNMKKPPQKLFFSATLSQDPEKLSEWALFQPKLFSAVSHYINQEGEINNDSLGMYTTPLELTEKYTVCEAESKPLILYHLLTAEHCDRVLCFTNSAQSTHRLAVLLKHLLMNQMNVAELSSAIMRKDRDLVMKKFHSGKINLLVSTDALARGIDFPNCDLVISYDPPKKIKSYMHRVGRTGRAGRSGTAITILVQNQFKMFQDILKIPRQANIHKIDIPNDSLQSFTEKYENAVLASGNEIKEEANKQIEKIKSRKRMKPRQSKAFLDTKKEKLSEID